MRKRQPATKADSRLRVENDLLTDEVRRLRAQLQQAEKILARRRPGERPSDRVEPELVDTRQESQRQLEAQALEDIRWLVGRVDGLPLGRLLRTRPGFRTIMERYGQAARH